ncbi:MAG TPA: hypothetical protein H9751_06890 [Candidatus Corynebacterium faecigallinarum]|uniref:Uncharacterized protein n=1 Tax=Candidatus Corynebacterium faecigallinarum TaxID=2838528 RepID=A0A9D2QFP4_9CORY|nr:hypothetical protein [Candidatus Corynebacterium faecigallinarum]
MSNTTPRPSAPDTPVRHPLSLLKPPASIRRTAERCAGLLRHPRARIRVTPGWQAPSTTVVLPAGTATVFVSRHRVSPAMWRALTKAGVSTAAPTAPLHLVTLSAVTETDHLHGTLRDMTVSVHSLFRQILAPRPDPTNSRGPDTDADRSRPGGTEWVGSESCGRLHADGQSLEWTWHALLTAEQLERRPSPGAAGPGTGGSNGVAA